MTPTGLADGLQARHPVPDDHPRVLAVMDRWWGGLYGESGAQQRAMLLPRLFFQHFTDSSQVVEDGDGRLVAFLVGFLSPAQPEVGYVHFVGVDPALRRSGLATALYDWFTQRSARHGARVVRCITSPANVTSIAFHTGIGFEVDPGDTVVDGVPVQRGR